MKFSVIVPVYNCEKVLPACIESVINQTWGGWELILVDDGSTDKSLIICKEYAAEEKRIRIIRQNNCGAGSARNAGMLQATGDYLVFCDADDYYEPNALERFVKNASEYKPDLIIGNYREFRYSDNGQIVYGTSKHITEEVLSDQHMIREKYIQFRKNGFITSPWAKAYRRAKVLESGVAFPNFRRCQDVVFNINFYGYVEQLCTIEDIVYNYQTPDGDTYIRKFPVNMFEIHKQVYELITKKLDEWKVLDKETRSYLNSCLLKDISVLLRLNYQNNWKLGLSERRELSTSILNDPLTRQACETKPSNRMNIIIRTVIKTRKTWVADMFSWGTLLYQKNKRRAV